MEKNQDKVNWYWLSQNPNAIHLLERNPTRINWYGLSVNPNSSSLLEKYPEKIAWEWISKNPSIFELDYNVLKERCSIYKWELLEVALHPSRIERYLEMGIEMGELDNYI